MSVDTRDKRFSMIGLGSPVPAVLPYPDGTIAAADRAMLLWLYHGLTLAESVLAAGMVDATFTSRAPAATFTDRG